MKVILLKDVKKQGKKDEVIEVSDGFATNYLIKNKLAVPYTKTSKNILNEELDKRNKEEEASIKEAKEIKSKLEKENVAFTVKSGKDGKIFGTISTKQIADKLKELGYNIDKKNIIIPVKIDSLGVYNIKIVLHKTVEATVKIHIC